MRKFTDTATLQLLLAKGRLLVGESDALDIELLKSQLNYILEELWAKKDKESKKWVEEYLSETNPYDSEDDNCSGCGCCVCCV